MPALALMSALAVLTVQDPPVTAEAAPSERSTDQARLDFCLFTPSHRRGADCEPLLQAEAMLIPEAAFTARDAMAWSGQACPPDQYPAAAARSECRREQRDLFRRSERARQALAQGAAVGVYAESSGHNVGSATSDTGTAEGVGFSDSGGQVGENCERRARTRRDQDSGSSASSYALVCSFGSDDDDLAERNRNMLGRLLEDDRRR